MIAVFIAAVAAVLCVLFCFVLAHDNTPVPEQFWNAGFKSVPIIVFPKADEIYITN